MQGTLDGDMDATFSLFGCVSVDGHRYKGTSPKNAMGSSESRPDRGYQSVRRWKQRWNDGTASHLDLALDVGSRRMTGRQEGKREIDSKFRRRRRRTDISA